MSRSVTNQCKRIRKASKKLGNKIRHVSNRKQLSFHKVSRCRKFPVQKRTLLNTRRPQQKAFVKSLGGTHNRIVSRRATSSRGGGFARGSYVGFVKPDEEETSRLTQVFLDLVQTGEANKSASIFTMLKKCLYPSPIQKKGVVNPSEGKLDKTFHIHPFVNTVEPDVVLYMIVNHKDEKLMKYAKDGLPRGYPFLYNKQTHWWHSFGFYPKFDNDERQTDNSSNHNDVHRIQFFKKWSGYMGGVIAWKDPSTQRLHWTTVSKNNADINSTDGKIHDMTEILMNYINEQLVQHMVNKGIHFCFEVLHQNDQCHGARVLKNDIIITMVGEGQKCDGRKIGKPVDYYLLEKVVMFCQQNKLPCDSGVKITGKNNCTQFLDKLAANRNDIVDTTMEQLIDKYGNRIRGTRTHQEILGECLEGLVLHLYNSKDEKITEKYKFPWYTIATMFLRASSITRPVASFYWNKAKQYRQELEVKKSNPSNDFEWMSPSADEFGSPDFEGAISRHISKPNQLGKKHIYIQLCMAPGSGKSTLFTNYFQRRVDAGHKTFRPTFKTTPKDLNTSKEIYDCILISSDWHDKDTYNKLRDAAPKALKPGGVILLDQNFIEANALEKLKKIVDKMQNVDIVSFCPDKLIDTSVARSRVMKREKDKSQPRMLSREDIMNKQDKLCNNKGEFRPPVRKQANEWCRKWVVTDDPDVIERWYSIALAAAHMFDKIFEKRQTPYNDLVHAQNDASRHRSMYEKAKSVTEKMHYRTLLREKGAVIDTLKKRVGNVATHILAAESIRERVQLVNAQHEANTLKSLLSDKKILIDKLKKKMDVATRSGEEILTDSRGFIQPYISVDIPKNEAKTLRTTLSKHLGEQMPKKEEIFNEFHVTLQHGKSRKTNQQLWGDLMDRVRRKEKIDVTIEGILQEEHFVVCKVRLSNETEDLQHLVSSKNPHITVKVPRGKQPWEASSVLQRHIYKLKNISNLVLKGCPMVLHM